MKKCNLCGHGYEKGFFGECPICAGNTISRAVNANRRMISDGINSLTQYRNDILKIKNQQK